MSYFLSSQATAVTNDLDIDLACSVSKSGEKLKSNQDF